MIRSHNHPTAARSRVGTMMLAGWQAEKGGRIDVQNFDRSRRAAFNSERPTPNAQRPLNAAKIARTFDNRSPRIGRWALGVGRRTLNALSARLPRTLSTDFA